MRPILEIQNVSKKFDISHVNSPHQTFREMLVNIFKASNKWEEFWALRDVSFDIFDGESVGIIGKNGSGKSTLLKILSKITPPTKGKVISRGRIASLLEVGTGFHPELTGIENIYLNGSILGMKQHEIKGKIDEIIDFAQVENFLDTPLKRYSSGMQLRLAFAVSVFLEPEILIIDEVLAVGDTDFQKKCMMKMEKINNSGRTILFVSHNLKAVERLCKNSLLLDEGRLKKYATTKEVVSEYLHVNASLNTSQHVGEYTFEASDKKVFISKVSFLCDEKLSNTFYMNCAFEIKVDFKSSVPLQHAVLDVFIYDYQNMPILGFNNKNYSVDLVSKPAKEGTISLTFPSLPLVTGLYKIDVCLSDSSLVLDTKKNITQLNVVENNFSKDAEILNGNLNKFFIKDVIWKTEIEK